jgi:hypothetical protein
LPSLCVATVVVIRSRCLEIVAAAQHVPQTLAATAERVAQTLAPTEPVKLLLPTMKAPVP